MGFKLCAICKLMLPLSVLVPIVVKHQGKLIRAFVCVRCKELKQNEAKEKNDKNTY